MKSYNPITTLIMLTICWLTIFPSHAQSPVSITCGASVNGSTIGAENVFDGKFYECNAEIFGNQYKAGEAIFQLELAKAQSVLIQLETFEIDFDLFLYSTVMDSVLGGLQAFRCIAAGISETDTKGESLIHTLDKGIYWLIIDNKFNSQGNFDLSVNCYDLPTACDLEGSLISPGNPIFNRGFDFDDLPGANFLYEPCLRPALPNYFGEFPEENVEGRLYTYLHEGPASAFSIDFNPGENITAFLFSCVNNTSSCMGIIEPGFNAFVNMPTGFYKIAVVNKDPGFQSNTKSIYSLRILGNSPCGGDDMVALDRSDDVLEESVTGKGNDLSRTNNNAYASCYTGTRNYNGEDMIFFLESDLENNDDELDTLYIELFLESAAPMGVFVYDYLCGENCLGYVETPNEGGKSDTLVLNLKAKSIYYLVVDSDDINASGNFTLTYDVNRRKKICEFEKNFDDDHIVSFTPNTAVFLDPGDRLYFTYDFNQDASFLNTEVFTDGDEGGVGPVNLAYQPDFNIENGSKKCGYDVGEQLVMIAEKQDGTIIEIEPNFQPANDVTITAEDKFAISGQSLIINMSVKEVSGIPMLDINPIQKKLNGSAGGTITAILQCHTNWNLVERPNWVTQVTPTEGLKDTKIDIVVSENTTKAARTGLLTFKSPVQEVSLMITQPASFCALNPVSLNLEQLDHPKCAGQATGAIDITATGSSEQIQYIWDKEIGNVEDPQNLSAGTYQVTVSDANNCSLVADFTLVDPSPISISMLETTDAVCHGQADGSINISAAGGTGTLSYLWDKGIGNLQNPANLGPDTYTVTITDENNCTRQESVTIQEPPAIQVVSSDISAVRCHGESNGRISVSAAGGSGDLSYSWDSGLGNVQNPEGLAAGAYQLTVTDTRACDLTQTFSVTEPEPISIGVDTISGDDGTGTGAIQISVSGGTPPYMFHWSAGGDFSSDQEDPAGLVAGAYQLTVTDGKGCTREQSVIVEMAPTSVEEEWLRNNVRIFPNPANRFIYLRKEGFAGANVHATLLDPTGRRIQSLIMEKTAVLYQMDIGDLPGGLYLIQLEMKGGVYEQKLIIH